MKYLIVAFKSRTVLQSFAKTLRLYGINASIVNTPHSISVSCGLSVRTEFKYLNSVINILNGTNKESFLGIYSIFRNGLYEQVEKIY